MALDSQALITKGTEMTGFDPRKFSKRTIRLALIGGFLGVLFWKYGDHIAKSFDDMVEVGWDVLYLLIIGIVVAGIWKQAGNLSDYISKTLLFWMIDYDPWVLQYKQIDRAEENWNKTLREKEKIAGRYALLSGKVKQCLEDNKIAKQAELICINELKDTTLSPLSRTTKEQLLADEQQKQVDNLNYIQNVEPLVLDMQKILDVIKTGSVVMKHKIERMRRSLTQLKDTYESTKDGREALEAMKKAMTGETTLNNQADLSKMKVLQDIALNIGQITTSMEIITEMTTSANLQDKAKMADAREKLQELGISTDSGAIPIDSFQTVNFKQVMTVADTKFGNVPD